LDEIPEPVVPRYLRTPDAALYLSLSASTLERHRCYGTGPRFHRIGRRIVYTFADLDAWAAVGRKCSTKDPGIGHVAPVRRSQPVRR
jgi:predicted DNA-binding transcriptional regulator AlpA